MDIKNALNAFAALSQETRLRIFKILIEYGKEGVAAGEISKRLNIPHNTLSFHLSHLSHAGLVSSKRQGRSIIYVAHFEVIDNLIAFLMKNCCLKNKGGCS